MTTLKLGSEGPLVITLKQRLRQRGFNVGAINGPFDLATQTAVRFFQHSVGLSVDGVVGPNTFAALSMPSITSNVSLDMVSQMFPDTPRVNVRFHLPYVLNGLLEGKLSDRMMVLMALGTIRAETASFQPIDEMVSIFNTPTGGIPFSKYDNRHDIGNLGPPDGATFKGRGFVQLTGRLNYFEIGKRIGLGSRLVEEPDLANDPDVASRILTAFLKAKEPQIRQALIAKDMETARRLVNGGIHGLDDFEEAFRIGMDVVPGEIQIQTAKALGATLGNPI